MKRETVKLSGDSDIDIDILNEGVIGTWKVIGRDSNYADLEKGYEDIIVILQRFSDKKFFKFEYSESPYNKLYESGNDQPLVGEEVFPVQKTIIVYE